jgi:hypothetical protein
VGALEYDTRRTKSHLMYLLQERSFVWLVSTLTCRNRITLRTVSALFATDTRVYPKVSGLSHNKINNNKNNKHSFKSNTQRAMAAKLTRLIHKIAIQLHLAAESCTICSSRSRRTVRRLLDTSFSFIRGIFQGFSPFSTWRRTQIQFTFV